PEGIFLIDSGGQYPDGTTDITRTVALGPVTEEMKRDFTLVLKGHIALDQAVFPTGTQGVQLDVLARQYLWKAAKNYGHGTGHGVGFFLNVHEGPTGISTKVNPQPPLEPGMLLSNEPGMYKTGEYGIRIENLMFVQEQEKTDFGTFLCFESVTLCPIDKRLISAAMLSEEERQWLNRYHARVREAIGPLVEGEVREWITQATAAM
ncbi:MAG: M24 family metallopeptidase, partial [Bacteroidia bacterium]|nr:M24 family metallopeptidase [Bacteroidia bacterium]